MLVQKYVSEGKKAVRRSKPVTVLHTEEASVGQNESSLDRKDEPITLLSASNDKLNFALSNDKLNLNSKGTFKNIRENISNSCMEYIESEDGIIIDLDGSQGDGKVRRQISDCCEYDSKIHSSKVSPNDQLNPEMALKANLSHSYYKNFLNQLKDDENQSENMKNSMGMVNVKTEFQPSSSSPNPIFDNYTKDENGIKTKKNSFLKVEEFCKSKQYRESKIPTNTSFSSGVEKSQIQNVALKNYDSRKTQYQQNKNKSFDLINYQSKRKSKFSKRNNKTHNFYYNVNELLKHVANSNTMKVGQKKDSISKERKHKRVLADSKNLPVKPSNLNKRQRFNQSKLYQRRSVTTTRGIDISPQIKHSMKSDIQRPTSSSGIENYKRNTGFKDYFKNDNILLRSNPLDLYEFKENSGKRNKFRNNSAMGTSIKTTKKAFSFVANIKKPNKSKQATSTHPGKRNSSRKSNGYSKKSHSFSMTKKFKGLQKIFIKDPTSRIRHHNQTPNNQISAMMSIQPT